MTKPGFIHTDQFRRIADPETRRVMFIEYKGKDISFDRWRFDLYYANHLAMCHFEESEYAALEFLAKNAPHCYANYADFRECAATA